jgi:molybdate transport system regulatory protein
LKLSARNRLEGIVDSVDVGIITAKVKMKVQKPAVVTAIITKDAVEDLKLKPGDKVEAIIKATSVMIAKE